MKSKKIVTQFILIFSLFSLTHVSAVTTYEVVNDTSGSTGTPSTYILYASKVGTGTGVILGINSATTTYSLNTQVTLTAQPDSGSVFTGWSNSCGVTLTCTLIMNTDRAISAGFNLTTTTTGTNSGGGVSGGGTSGSTGGGSVSSNTTSGTTGAYVNPNNVGLGTPGAAVNNNPAINTTPAYIFKADLRLMSRHPEVIKLQQFLNARGYRVAVSGAGSPGLESDYFGFATKAALARFQRDNNIFPPEGFFGNLTKAYINRLPGTGTQPSIPATLPTTGKYIFTKNLTLNTRDVEVIKLQQFLNGKGYTVSVSGAGSSGLESTFFGQATRAALARWQKDNGITPSVGYFGNLTRQVMNR